LNKKEGMGTVGAHRVVGPPGFELRAVGEISRKISSFSFILNYVFYFVVYD